MTDARTTLSVGVGVLFRARTSGVPSVVASWVHASGTPELIDALPNFHAGPVVSTAERWPTVDDG